MTFTQLVSILAARWRIALVVLALVVAAAAALNELLPRRYTASASVLIDLKTPDPITGGISPGMMTASYMATQVDVIQSERVARRVVRALKFDTNPAMRAQWQQEAGGAGSYERWLADLVQGSLDVKPSRESNVITLSYKSVDPKFAAALANAFAQAFVDVTLDLRVEPARQYTGFFDARSKQLREAVEAAQARLSAFQKEKGIVAGDERLDVETARLNELSSQLVALQAMTAESRSREAQAKSAAGTLQDVINHPVVAGLRADLTRQEARLQELGARLGDAHPQVREQRASLAELRARLEQEMARVGSSVGVSNSINQSREAQVRAALEAQRAKVLELKALRDEVAVLTRDVEHAQRAYDTVLTRSTLTSLESQTTQTNVVVLNPAAEPIEPSSPRRLVNLLIAVFLGTLLGVCAALAREFADRRVRSGDDLAGTLQLPLLGHLPSQLQRRRRWPWQRRPRGGGWGEFSALPARAR